MKQIAILGGTFDPIHNGHLKLAENAYAQFSLDEVWFMPAPNPPHKTGRRITDYRDRFAMVELAIKPYKGFVCSDYETRREGKSYTSETVAELTADYPDCQFHFVLGADSFYEFQNWHEPGTILKYVSLIVADRDYAKNHASLGEQAAFLKEQFGARVQFIHAPEVDISSEYIRSLYAAGKKKAARLTPPAVAEYIAAHHLYGQ